MKTKECNFLRRTIRIGIVFIIIAFQIFSNSVVRAADLPGLIPLLANWTPQPGGYTVILINYDPSFQWTIRPGTGQYYFDGQHQITVTGAFAGFPSSLTVASSKPGYTTQSVTITGDVMGMPWNYTPNIQLISQTPNSFSAQITNYDPSLIWQWSETAGDVTLSSTGRLTVSNLKRGQSSTVTLKVSKLGYLTLTSIYTQNSQPPPMNLIPSLGQMTANNQTISLPVTNFDNYFEWSVTSTAGTPAIDRNTGLITLGGLTASQVAKVTIVDSYGGQTIGQASFLAYLSPAALNLKPQFGSPQANLNGFQVQISNYDPFFSWNVSSNLGNANVDSRGLITVTNMQPGQTATVNVSSSIQGASASYNTITVPDWPSQGLALEVTDVRQTADGFTFKINDYNRFYDYQGSTDQGQLNINTNGQGSVSGLGAGQKAHVLLNVGKNGITINSAQVDSAAVLDVNLVLPDVPIPSAKPIQKKNVTPKASQQSMTGHSKSATKTKPINTSSKPIITIICLKGSVHKFVTSVSPKCPAGFNKQN